MAAPWAEYLKNRRYGPAIVVVSGLPRSGTSMMMGMLRAGGLDLVVDEIRGADLDNPNGYFEYELVKDLDKGGDKAWLRECRGRGIKIVSSLLRYLPTTNRYKVIFMRRDLEEVLASQNKMLDHRGESQTAGDAKMREHYEGHLKRTELLFDSLSCFEALDVHYKEALEHPLREAERAAKFVGGLDPGKMAGMVNEQLYRNRR